MAKITPPQEIPSALLAEYLKAVGVVDIDNSVQKRYPFRIPPMQTLVGHPSPKQKTQRARFIVAKDNFAGVDWPTRQRWYAAAPEWGSFLWYYNYFIMSSLIGNADAEHGGAGVIKSIQFKEMSMPAGAGEGQVAITAIDPAKSVVMLYGNSAIIYEWEQGSVVVLSYPYVSSIAAELIKCKWSIKVYGGEYVEASTIGLTIIEYI